MHLLSPYRLLPHVDHATNAVARLHIRKGLVDLVNRLPMRDELVHLQVSLHVVRYQAR
jgi:hypothetical protein